MEETYFFDSARVGDEICLVDDMACSFKMDRVYSILQIGGNSKSRYLHLEQSKMIVTEAQKHIIYPKSEAKRLYHALNKLRDSTERDWIKYLPALLAEQGKNNKPEPSPPPNGTIDF